MAGMGFGITDFVQARIKAAADTVTDGAQKIQSEGPLGDAVQIVTSAFGLLPVNDFGRAAQKRREAARAHITHMGR